MDFRTDDFRAQIARYQQELLQLQQQQPPAPQPPAPQPPAPQPPAPQSPAPQSPAPQSPAPQPPAPQPGGFTAPLQVRVSTAGGAVPLPGALVVISSQGKNGAVLKQTRFTDNSGLTEPVLLPAVDPALTQQPNTPIPPIVYEVAVSAPGFYRVRAVGVPLYGGIPTQLPVVLIPLPEFSDAAGEELQFPTPPINL